MINRKRIIKSMVALAKDVGFPEILELPIDIAEDLKGPPAYTDSNGIWIRRDLAEKDPDNVKVFILHEILHHVISDHESTGHYQPEVVNVAEDFKINQFMREHFGYDVRKVLEKGLLSRKYDRKTVVEICQEISQKQDIPIGACGCRGMANAIILKCAREIRRRYAEELKVGRQPLFYSDIADQEVFLINLESVRQSVKLKSIGVNLDQVLEGLWDFLYLNRPVARPVMGDTLGRGQALTYCFPASLYREQTQGNPVEALFAASLFLRKVDQDIAYTRERMLVATDLMKMLATEISFRRSHGKKCFGRYKRLGLRELIRRHKQAVQVYRFWKEKRPLRELLEQEPVKIGKPIAPNFTPISLRHSGKTDPTDAQIPRLLPSETRSTIRAIARRGLGDFKKVGQALKSLQETLGVPLSDLTPAPSDKKEQNTSLKNEPTKFKMMELLYNNIGMLDKIVHNMNIIKTQLAKRARRKPQDNNELDSTYSYGDDINRMVPEEAAYLANEQSRLAFFVRYAQQGLMLHSPTENKRYPVTLLLDGSGSMEGRLYNIAAGFALAIIGRLRQDNRGVALVIFGLKVTHSLVFPAGQPFNMQEVLEAICSPDYDGTSFDEPLAEARRIRDGQGWRSMLTFMATDAYCDINDPQAVLDSKNPGDKNVAVVVSKSDVKHLKPAFDEVYRTNKKDLGLDLISAGIEIL